MSEVLVWLLGKEGSGKRKRMAGEKAMRHYDYEAITYAYAMSYVLRTAKRKDGMSTKLQI